MAGAALSSAISYVLSGVLMLAACRRNHFLTWKWKEFSLDKGLMRECAAVGTPVLGASVVSCLGYVVFAGLVSGMGTTVFAAHSIAVTAETIFYVPGYGLRSAASTLIKMCIRDSRMCMLLTDYAAIRDVLLFPTMKSLGGSESGKAEKSTGDGKRTAGEAAAKTGEKIDFSKVQIEPLFEDMVDFETFSKSDFRAVKVKECEAVPKSKKLLKFVLDEMCIRDSLSGVQPG